MTSLSETCKLEPDDEAGGGDQTGHRLDARTRKGSGGWGL